MSKGCPDTLLAEIMQEIVPFLPATTTWLESLFVDMELMAPSAIVVYMVCAPPDTDTAMTKIHTINT